MQFNAEREFFTSCYVCAKNVMHNHIHIYLIHVNRFEIDFRNRESKLILCQQIQSKWRAIVAYFVVNKMILFMKNF